MSIDDNAQLALPPPSHVPEHEAWLYKNLEALELVRAGLAEAAAGLATPVEFPDAEAESQATTPLP